MIAMLLSTALAHAGWQRTELMFGTSAPDGDTVDNAEWSAFVDDAVLPRFPDGFLIEGGRGHWRGDDQQPVDEETHVLILAHKRTVAADKAIDEIRATYCERFKQESVLRVDVRARVQF